MGFSARELVAIGERCSTQRLLEQLPVSVATAKAHASVLDGMFPSDKTDMLEGYIESIRTLFESQSDNKVKASTGNVPVGDVMKSLKERIRNIIASADNAFEESPKLQNQFHKGGPLGRSVPAMIRKAETILAAARENAAALAEWGVDETSLTEAGADLDALVAANTAQEQAMKNLPPSTQRLYEEKGKAYLLLKKLARAGRRRYAGAPAVAAKFNLDILNRKGGSRKEDESVFE